MAMNTRVILSLVRLPTHFCCSSKILSGTQNSKLCIFLKRFSAGAIEFPIAKETTKQGLLLGIYQEEKEKNKRIFLTPASEVYNKANDNKLTEFLASSGPFIAKNKSRLFYGLDEAHCCVCVVNLGQKDFSYNDTEDCDEIRESVRSAVAVGAKQLRDVGITKIFVDPCGDAEAAAEGGCLSLFSYEELKEKKSRKPVADLMLMDGQNSAAEWKKGTIMAEGQNICRHLMETPSNILTPSRFAENVMQKLTAVGVEVTIRDKAWAEKQKMGAFLSVAQGSEEAPVFLEISYRAGPSNKKPLAFVGKGITFDSGGISLKPAQSMDKMRGDMGGAACVVGAMFSIAALKVPINIVGLIPLCENMPSGRATRPGDVVTAMNGKTIQVDNTDAEGRLILADALCFAHSFDPEVILDVATLTGAMDVALGSGATGVFTNSSKMWELIHKAGKVSGDRVWRMPLFKHYKKQITESNLADLNNIGKHQRQGGACIAAAFLKEFVTNKKWLHLDIAGVMENKDEVAYLCKGMSGRPTRTLVEFAKQMASKDSTS